MASPHENISQFNPIFLFTGQPTFPDAYTNIYRFPYDGIASAAFTTGGIISNAIDVVRWGNALFTGKATSAATLDSMLHSISSTPDAQGDYLGYGIWKSSRMSTTETFLGHDGNAPGYRTVMFYQPEKKITIAVMSNYHGADMYTLTNALLAALPEFAAGNDNRKETKVNLCFNGKLISVDRNAADGFIRKGAYLGSCESTDAKTTMKSTEGNLIQKTFSVYPNPSSGSVQFNFEADASGPVQLDLFDANGKLVCNVFKGTLQKGTVQQAALKKTDLPAGVYFASLKTTAGIKQQKIVFTK